MREVVVQIADSVFVVTGAGNGIGREVSLELARRGAKVAAIDVSEDGLRETIRLAGVDSDFITAFPTNITNKDAVAALPQTVLTEFGVVDGLLNIAGIIQRFVPIGELSIEEIEKLMAVNFWGTLYMVKAFLPALGERPQACLLNVSSMGGLVPVPGQGAYGASKGAVKLLTETLYAELMDTNIAVTVVFPGGVGTNIAANSGVEAPKMKSGATAKVTAPSDAARQIVDAVATGTFRVLIGSDARSLDRASRLAPTYAIKVVARKMKGLLGK